MFVAGSVVSGFRFVLSSNNESKNSSHREYTCISQGALLPVLALGINQLWSEKQCLFFYSIITNCALNSSARILPKVQLFIMYVFQKGPVLFTWWIFCCPFSLRRVLLWFPFDFHCNCLELMSVSWSKFEDRWKDRIANNLLNCLRSPLLMFLMQYSPFMSTLQPFKVVFGWFSDYTKDSLCTGALPLDAWCPLGGQLICTVVACVGLFLQHSATGTTTEGAQNNPMLEKLSSKQFIADLGLMMSLMRWPFCLSASRGAAPL